MENRSYDDIIGNGDAPHLNQLAATYGLATNYYAITHPSEPNYLALFGGSTFGVHDDGVYNIASKNLADQLEARRRSWLVFAQNLPARCSTAASARERIVAEVQAASARILGSTTRRSCTRASRAIRASAPTSSR